MACLKEKRKPIDRCLRISKTGAYYLRFFYALPLMKRRAVDIGLHTHELHEARIRGVQLLRMIHSVNKSTGYLLGLVYPMDKNTLSLNQ